MKRTIAILAALLLAPLAALHGAAADDLLDFTQFCERARHRPNPKRAIPGGKEKHECEQQEEGDIFS